MSSDLSAGFAMFADIYNVVAIFGGVVIGTVVGAIPGMTGTMAVALALPFTFYMSPVTAILLLVGLYKGAMYGGSITAILIKTPGTPAAAATVLDGFPMAQRGEAGKALNMALYASCIADFISNLSLIFLTGLIAGFALSFGPPEFFALICFSLTIIAGVSGGSLLKGVISAGLGLLFAVVGMDIVYGSERLTFGRFELMEGLSFIPVLIGLFAIPEMLEAYRQRWRGKSDMAPVGASRVSRAEFTRCLPAILRGSFIGVALGAIPGIGGAPAAFLSYSEARRASPHPERFGRGEIQGVAAAESGNNGVCGATLIPLLSLGIPGDVITAVMLGAFMIHGLSPGPLLFQQNLPVVYALYFGIMLSSVFLFITGKAMIRGFARVADVPNPILFPAVLVLCFYGAYAVNGNMLDVLVMVAMGVFGFGMLTMGLPAAPFLIAFILGPLFEDNFRRSMLMSHGDPSIFFRTWICWLFLGLTVLSLAMLLRPKRTTPRKEPPAPTHRGSPAPSAAPRAIDGE